jgi:4-hydroxyphenylpyruvate dioxygenase-like putative hemolysin
MGTDGFEFIEYAAPDPVAMGALFERMGLAAIARHRQHSDDALSPGRDHLIINAEFDLCSPSAARLHGPSICATRCVQDAWSVAAARTRAWAAPPPARASRTFRHQGHGDRRFIVIVGGKKQASRTARSAT